MSSPQLAQTTPQPARPDSEYEYWRWRILIGTMIGYIFFYFVRKSISMAMPGLEEVGVTKTTLGLFLTVHGVLYGVARFVNGVWSDRVNPRYFMSIGLLLAALTNVFCGLAPSTDSTRLAWIIGSFWIINGWVQGMGFPPCAKSLTHWFAPREHGVKFATWNISHSFGAGLIFLLNSFVVAFGWRYCFLVPAALSISGAAFLFWALRDSPEKEGFDPVEKFYERTRGKKRGENAEAVETEAAPCAAVAEEPEEADAGWFANLRKHVFSNWAIWVLCFANFFVYIVRFSILDWAPTFLSQAKGFDLKHAGWVTACYEICGALGIILSGILMDKLFRGRGAKVCFWYMIGCAAAALAFWKLDSDLAVVNVGLMCVLGFFIYGPQCLIGCVASTVATKKAAAASSGLTGLFGYLATIVTGLGVGMIADNAIKAETGDRDKAIVQVVASAQVPTSAANAGFDAALFNEALEASQKKLGSAASKALVKKDAEAVEVQELLTKCVQSALGESADESVAASVAGEYKTVLMTEAEARQPKIIEALKTGWTHVFGMLVISSLAAAVLFATILNLASPEVVREEKESAKA